MSTDSKEGSVQTGATQLSLRDPVVISDVSYSFGVKRVLDHVSLKVAPGEIVCLLGASGSGKSTLLRIIAGLLPLQEGTVRIGGLKPAVPGDEPPPEIRNCGFVFQDHVLFPHLTVIDNVAFGLFRTSASERISRALDQLREVGLAEHAQRYPDTLSGGEQQRVALARALAPDPSVMLLDEAFANVDSALRRNLREDARLALRASGAPCIVVTHDPEEAMELADRIVVLQDGRVVQDDLPEAIWRNPKTQFVASLFCGTDAITGRAMEGKVETVFGTMEGVDVKMRDCQECLVIAHPESLHLEASSVDTVRVVDIRFLGDHYLVIVEASGERLRVISAVQPTFATGDSVSVSVEPEGVYVYPVDDNESH
ncbi:MAG: ABC transporter ATP-binding protein [Gammaproteobacteria bacterium]|nr:ABC transporter ATP-binding protein [Gammaproteobacteria bacterium]